MIHQIRISWWHFRICLTKEISGEASAQMRREWKERFFVLFLCFLCFSFGAQCGDEAGKSSFLYPGKKYIEGLSRQLNISESPQRMLQSQGYAVHESRIHLGKVWHLKGKLDRLLWAISSTYTYIESVTICLILSIISIPTEVAAFQSISVSRLVGPSFRPSDDSGHRNWVRAGKRGCRLSQPDAGSSGLPHSFHAVWMVAKSRRVGSPRSISSHLQYKQTDGNSDPKRIARRWEREIRPLRAKGEGSTAGVAREGGRGRHRSRRGEAVERQQRRRGWTMRGMGQPREDADIWTGREVATTWVDEDRDGDEEKKREKEWKKERKKNKE